MTRTLYVVNPARAGMILSVYWCFGAAGRKPRASGDDPNAHLWTTKDKW